MGSPRAAEISKSIARLALDLAPAAILIGTVALIAAVHLDDARTRTQAGIVRHRFNAVAAGLGAYYIDHGAHPQCNTRGGAFAYGPYSTPILTTPDATGPVLERMTTPVAYILQTDLIDPYEMKFRRAAATAQLLVTTTPTPVSPASDGIAAMGMFGYQAWNKDMRAQVSTDTFAFLRVPGQQWLLQSVGPDESFYSLGGVLTSDVDPHGPIQLFYDPTNGTYSAGSIFMMGGNVEPYTPPASYAAGKGLREAWNMQPRGPAEPSDASAAVGWQQLQ